MQVIGVLWQCGDTEFLFKNTLKHYIWKVICSFQSCWSNPGAQELQLGFVEFSGADK